MADPAALTQLIREKLDDTRYGHSLAVAGSARELALRCGADPEAAYCAGLVHDIMKCTERQTQLQVIADTGIVLTACEQSNPNLWHAIAGEAFLRGENIITDEAVLSAVRYHTTGRAGMTLLEKIIFLADFISADRSYPDLGLVREKAAGSLEEAILYTLEYNIPKWVERREPIHPDSIALYNECLSDCETQPDSVESEV